MAKGKSSTSRGSRTSTQSKAEKASSSQPDALDLNGDWMSIADNGDRQRAHIEHTGKVVHAVYLRPRLCLDSGPEEASADSADGPGTMTCFEARLTGPLKMEGTASVCWFGADEENCHWTMEKATFSIDEKGQKILGEWRDAKARKKRLFTLQRMEGVPVKITQFLLFDRPLKKVGAKNPPVAVPLRHLKLHSRNASEESYVFPGTLVLTGTPNDQVSSLSLEIVSDGEVVAVASATDDALNRLEPFDAKGKIALDLVDRRPEPLFSIEMEDLWELCRAEKRKVTLRVRVNTDGGWEATETWGPVGLVLCLEDELRQLQVACREFAGGLMNDARARAVYLEKIKLIPDICLEEVDKQTITLEEALDAAIEMRNFVMRCTREVSSAGGLLLATLKKGEGRSLEWVIQRQTQNLFKGMKFEQLNSSQREQVFIAGIRAAGKDNSWISPAALKGFPRFSRGFLVLTAALSTFNIYMAENRAQAMLKEVVVLGGAYAGMVGVPAAAGLVFGGPPGAFAALVLYFVGGFIGGYITEGTFELAFGEREFLIDWLGDEVPHPQPAPPPILPPPTTPADRPSATSKNKGRDVEATEPASGREMRIDTVYMVEAGSVLHLLDKCPALQSATHEVQWMGVPGTSDIDELSAHFNLPPCGTCLRMLGLHSQLLFGAESAIQILEIRSDCVRVITKPFLWRSEVVLEVRLEDITGVEKKGPIPLFSSARIVIKYQQGLMLPSGEEVGGGHINFSFQQAVVRDTAYETVIDLVSQQE